MNEELPDNLDEFPDWVRENCPKWKKDTDEATMVRILVTSDGLGSRIKNKALEYLRKQLQEIILSLSMNINNSS
jgi:hypothetical protein